MIPDDTEQKVLQWAMKRGLFENSTAWDQATKLIEEQTELLTAIHRDQRGVVIDSIGDMMVVLTMIAHFYDVDLQHCYNYAYLQIKDRTGKMVDGVFVKDDE